MRTKSVPEDRSAELALLERARSKDRDAFAELVGRYQPALENLLFGYVRDRDRAREIVQETVYRAFVHLDRYSGEHRFSTWFFRIGVNLTISHHRKTKREIPGGDAVEAPDHTGSGSSVLEDVVRREDLGRLRSALQDLPPRYREVLQLRYLEGLECQEIARRTKTTPNAVSIVIFRAKERLKEALER